MPVQVLLVDDCDFLRTAIAGLLMTDGSITVVGQAANGAEGLELVNLLQPQVIVTDLEMPVMDGAEFIARQLQIRYLPIIIFSAVNQNSPLAVRARQAGAVAHLRKPLAIAEVVAQQSLLKAEILAQHR